MRDKRITEDDVVRQLTDGMTIGIGGWGSRRKPMSLVRAILRSPLKELTIVSYGGPDVGLLCAAGKVKKVVYGFVSLDSIPLEPHFRAARQNGTIEAVELDEGMLQWGLYAASLRLPFLPTRAGLGSDVMRVNPHLKTVKSPYEDEEELVAVPAIPLDVALIHMNRADKRGNGQFLGPDPYFDDLFCMAAKQRFMSCERVVETADLLEEGSIHTLKINRMMIDGVIEAPQGAHFTSVRSRIMAATRRSSASTPPRRPIPPSGRPSQPAIWSSITTNTGRRSRADDPLHPRRALHHRLRRRLAWRRRDPGEPHRGYPHHWCARRPGHIRAGPAALGWHRVAWWRASSRSPGAMPGWSRAGSPTAPSSTLSWSGRRHVMMGAAQLDRFGNQNIACIGLFEKPKAQLLGMRGAPGNTINHATSYWVPNHSTRVFVPKVDVVSGIGTDRARALGDAGRFHSLRHIVTNKCVFDLGGPDGTVRLVSLHPGVTREEVQTLTGFPIASAEIVPETRAPTAEELRLIREVIDPAGLRRKEIRGMSGTALAPVSTTAPRSALHTRICDLFGIQYPIVQTGMGWVAGARLTAATSAAGGLGILASATMTLDQLTTAVREVKERTDKPFGVNLRIGSVGRERARRPDDPREGEGREFRPGARQGAD